MQLFFFFLGYVNKMNMMNLQKKNLVLAVYHKTMLLLWSDGEKATFPWWEATSLSQAKSHPRHSFTSLCHYQMQTTFSFPSVNRKVRSFFCLWYQYFHVLVICKVNSESIICIVWMHSVTMIEMNRFSVRSYVPIMEVLVHSWLILTLTLLIL
jgi:hypothetical protein